MLHKVWKVIYGSIIDGKHIVELGTDIFVYPFVDKANEHITFKFTLPIFENNVGVTMSFSKY